ncbi:choice-of-anchor A family protein [Agarivorans sp. TSD2052]|uniref:choice-of-anchor A family protein n=1 Tax=Agarivorans sp. TSD2052 TaxID=2937286 RepID=UPI00200ED405|nr:choice-of-anchor A family protein [Agarivorans sp. TSD2052]UPW18990.1 choice-of-anchor A family protein [Agarivorans sp. TSD2052]
MKHLKQYLLISLATIASVLMSLSSHAGILGLAGNYNTFIFNDFSGSSDTEGRLAVGGNAHLQNYSVGDKLGTSSDQVVLTVAGNLQADYGRVYGAAEVGGSANVTQAHGYADGGISENSHIAIDFAAEHTYLNGVSNQLSSLSSNGNVLQQWGGLYLSGDGQSQQQVFELDGNDLLNAHTFEVSNLADDAEIIFNISGGSAGLSNMSMASLLPSRDKVLFNFYEATELLLSGISVEGSILAPLANVQDPQGVINGTVIAASWDGAMQQNHVPYTATPPPSSVPEPGSALLFAAAIFLLAWQRRFSLSK